MLNYAQSAKKRGIHLFVVSRIKSSEIKRDDMRFKSFQNHHRHKIYTQISDLILISTRFNYIFIFIFNLLSLCSFK